MIYEKNKSLENKKISLPIVTSGITHAVSTFADLWIDPDDTVILPLMMWGNYNMIFNVRNRAKIVTYDSFSYKLKGFNLKNFENKIKQQAEISNKIITILNFPHNPSGYSVSVEEAHKIIQILVNVAKSGTNVVVACDDAYFGLFFQDETIKESLFSFLAGAHKRLVAVKLDGATKEDYTWGLRTGFITYGFSADKNLEGLYEALEKKTGGCIRGNISNASHLSQSIILKSMDDEKYSQYKQEKFNILKKRAIKIKDVVYDKKYQKAWEVYAFNSGYFMCLRLKYVEAEKLRIHLLNKYGIGLITIGNKNLRIAFSCLEEENIQILFDTILKGINDLIK